MDVWDKVMATVEQAAKSKTFPKDQRAQAELMFAIAGYYFTVTTDKQQAVRAKLCPVLPRLKQTKRKGVQATFEAIMELARFPTGFEEISRALKIRAEDYEGFVPDPEEDIYPKTGWIGDYMTWVRNGEVPLGYHFWSAVGIIGAACGYKFFIDRGSYYLRLNFYTVMVGEKATGKSAAKDAAVDVLRKANFLIEPHIDQEHRHQVRLLPEDTNQETLVRKLAARTDTVPSDIKDAPAIPVLVDSTGIMVLDELSTFLGKDNWALAKRIPFLTTMYGREYYDYETQTGGSIKLQNIALSMLACSAPEWMKDSITPLMFGGGFMDRTMFIYRNNVIRSYPTPAPLDPVAAVRLSHFIKHLASRDKSTEMLPTPDAIKWYDVWYNYQPKTSDLTGMSTKRRANHIWKLAAILSLSDGDAPWIKETHIKQAAEYLAHEEVQFQLFIDQVQRAPEADLFKYIIKVLRKNGGSLLQNRLFDKLRNKRALSPPSQKAVPFMRSLEQMGLVETTRDGKSTRYTLTEDGMKDDN